MILIYPPSAKPTEPPAGMARLAGALHSHGVDCTLLDANLEAFQHVRDNAHTLSAPASDKWTARAFRNATANHDALKNRTTYHNIDRYKRAVIDLNHALEKSIEGSVTLGLANYRHHELSPLRSADLIRAAEDHESNPFYPYLSKRLHGLVQKSAPSVAGFSINYLSQALCAFAMIGFIRSNFPDMRIVLGGGLVTSWMQSPNWNDPFTGFVDNLIAGPGEHQILAIMGINATEEKHFTPDYELLPLDDYLAPGRILPFSASSGCYWNKCSFCPEKAEDNPYIALPVDRVMADLNSLTAKYKPSLLHLLDNAVSPALLKRLAAGPSGVPWYGFARISSLLTDIDFCMALKKSGCVMLKLGLESGDQGVLDSLQKGIDVETASLVLKTLKKAGIAAYVYLLFGTPPETLPEARSTLEFVVRHKDEIGFLNVAVFNMPECGAESSVLQTSSFYEGDLSLYTDFTHPGGWGRKQVRRFLDNEFRKHKAVAEILRNDPPIFTSNHAPLFAMENR